RPWLIRRRAAEFDTVMQSERTIVPELEPLRRDAPAAQTRRTGDFADDVPCREFGDCLLEGEPAFQRLRLLARPGADLGLPGAGGEIGVGLRITHRRHAAANADLAAQRFPVE